MSIQFPLMYLIFMGLIACVGACSGGPEGNNVGEENDAVSDTVEDSTSSTDTSDAEDYCEDNEWRDFVSETCESCEDKRLRCDDFDFSSAPESRSMWDGESETLRIYVKPHRAELVASTLTGTLMDSEGAGSSEEIDASISEDTLTYDLDSIVTEEKYFEVDQLSFQDACGNQIFESAFTQLRAGQDRQFIVTCSGPSG
mgnify:FL=1